MNSFAPNNDATFTKPTQEFSPFENNLVENGVSEAALPDKADQEPDQMNGESIGAHRDFKPKVPSLIRQLQGQIVELGVDSVTFSCEFKNATGVGWSFNGKVLAPDDKYDIAMDGNEVVLTVKDVGLEDSGVYICYAINTDGRVTTVGYLSVRGIFEKQSQSGLSIFSYRTIIMCVSYFRSLKPPSWTPIPYLPEIGHDNS